MAAEVVGTAFVRVRALTKQLNEDIKKGVDKGIQDAKVSEQGEEAGDEFAEGFGGSSSEGIKGSLKDTFEDDETDDAAEEGGERSGGKWSDGFRNRLNTSMGDTFRNVFRRGDRDRDVRLGGEKDGETYGEGFKDGLGDDRRGIFSGLLSGLSRGIGGALRGLGGALGGLLDFGGGGGDEGGSSLGKSFAGGFKKGFAGAMAGFSKIAMSLIFNPVVLIGSLIATITPLLVNGFIALGSMLGTVLAGAIGGGLALGAGLIAGVLALGPIIAAFTVDTPLLELFKEEMKAIGEEFKVFAELVQEQILPGVLLLAETFVDELMPTLDDFGVAVGDAFGDFTEHLADLISRADVVDRIGNILSSSADGFRGFLQAMIPLTDFVLRIMEGLAPLARTVADDLNVMFSRWNDWAAGVGASGLESTFRGFYDTFKLVMGGLSDLTVALFNILMIGDSATGQGFFERFREWAREFREFTTSDSGIAKIQGIFERAQPVMSEFAGLLGDIIRLLFEGATSEGATSGTVGALRWLRHEALPWLTDVGFPALKGAISGVLDGLKGAASVLEPFARAMIESFSPAVKETIAYFGERGSQLFDTMRQALEDLEGPLARIGDALRRGLGSFFDVLRAFADSGALELAVAGLVLMVDAFSRFISMPGIPEFIGLIAGGLLILTKVILPAIAAIKVIGGIIAAVLVPSVAIPLAIAAAIAALAYVIYRNWDTIVGFFSGIAEAIGNFIGSVIDFEWSEIPGMIADAFGEALDFLEEWGRKAIGAIKDFVTGLPRALVSLGSSLIRVWWSAFTAILTWLVTQGLPMLLRFWISLPGKIVNAIGKLGEPLGKIFNAAFDFLLLELPVMLIKILGWFLTIPSLIFGALEALGTFIGDAFRAAWDYLWEKLPELFQQVMDWYLDLPGEIFDLLWDLGNKIVSAFRSAWDFLWLKLPELFGNIKKWITDLPGNIKDFLLGDGKNTGLFAKIRDAFKSAFDSVKTWLEEKGTQIIEWFEKLPNKIRTAVREIVKAVKEELEGKLDWVENVPIVGPAVVSFAKIFEGFAVGGIFDKPTVGLIGEAGREVLLPLTDPMRTYQLAMQSGLFDVLAKVTGTRTPAPVLVGGGGDSGADIDRLADRIIAALPEAGDRIELVVPSNVGQSNAVRYAMATARELRSEKWRRGK